MAATDDPVLIRFRAALGAAYGDRIERVALFGSRARGDARPDSEHDVAVFLRDIGGVGEEIGRLVDLGNDILVDTGALNQRRRASGRGVPRPDRVHGRGPSRRRRPVTPEVAAHLARAMEGRDEARLIPAAPPLARVAARSA